MNLLDEFIKRVDENPGNIAIIDANNKKWTYRQILERAAGLAQYWQSIGLKSGDKVLVATGFNADLYSSLAALWWLGVVVVFPEPSLGLAGVRVAIETTRPKAILLGGIYNILPFLLPDIRQIPLRLKLKNIGRKNLSMPQIENLPKDAAALISFTTGSTGYPKAIVRTHGFMKAQDKAIAPLIKTYGKNETDLVGFPVFVIANLGQGISSVLPNWSNNKIDKIHGNKIAKLIRRSKVSRLLINPAIMEKLLDAEIPNSVHTIFTGGGPVFPDVIKRVKEQYPDIKFYAVYGSTEAETIAEIDANNISIDDFKAMENGAGILAGYPADAAKVRIFDNEIQVAGNHVVKGYLNPAHDGDTKIFDDDTLWHRTGDAGYFDKKGRLWLLGRINSRVGDLWSFPIEAAARTWGGIKRAALIAHDNQPLLVIEGDAANYNIWVSKAANIGIHKILHMEQIPVDRRHGSKIDINTLKNRLIK